MISSPELAAEAVVTEERRGKLGRSNAVHDEDPSPPPPDHHLHPSSSSNEQQLAKNMSLLSVSSATASNLTPNGPEIQKGLVSQGSNEGPSPSLSRDSSTELYTDSSGTDLHMFIVETLQKKDRNLMLTIEKTLISLVKDAERNTFKFQPMPNPYHRMLVHRVAAFFGMEHNVDKTCDAVVVNKTKNTRIPDFRFDEIQIIVNDEPKKLLKRDSASFDGAQGDKERSPDRKGTINDLRSKSFEEREVNYAKARERIFNQQDSSSSNDGGDVSVGNTASDTGGRSPSNASGCAPTVNSSLDDLGNTTGEVRPWSSVESDESTRNPRLTRSGKALSKAISPSTHMDFLRTPGNLTSSGSATELSRLGSEKAPKLSHKSVSEGECPTSVSNSTISASGARVNTSIGSGNSINHGPASGGTGTPSLRKAFSLNAPNLLPNHTNGGMQRGRSTDNFPGHNRYHHNHHQPPLLANPTSFAPTLSTSSHKPSHHWHGRRSDNGQHQSMSVNPPLLGAFPAPTPQDLSQQYWTNPHLNSSLQPKDQQQLPPMQQAMLLHQVANYLQGEPHQQNQSGPCVPSHQQPGPSAVYYPVVPSGQGAPGAPHLQQQHQQQSARTSGSGNQFAGRMPMGASGNAIRAQGQQNHPQNVQQHQLLAMNTVPGGLVSYIQQPMPAVSIPSQPHALPGSQQDQVRYYYMNPPPQPMVLPLGPPNSTQSRALNPGPAISGGFVGAMGQGGPYGTGPVSMAMPMQQMQTGASSIPANVQQMQPFLQHPAQVPQQQAHPMQNQSQHQQHSAPGLLPMPLTFPNPMANVTGNISPYSQVHPNMSIGGMRMSNQTMSAQHAPGQGNYPYPVFKHQQQQPPPVMTPPLMHGVIPASVAPPYMSYTLCAPTSMPPPVSSNGAAPFMGQFCPVPSDHLQNNGNSYNGRSNDGRRQWRQ